MTCAVYCHLHLTGKVIKAALQSLENERRRQVVCAGIVCATGFKHFLQDGRVAPATCANGCGQREPQEDMIQWNGLRWPKERVEAEKWATFLCLLAKRSGASTRAIPPRFVIDNWTVEEEYKISLGDDYGSLEYLELDTDGKDSLNFDERENGREGRDEQHDGRNVDTSAHRRSHLGNPISSRLQVCTP